MMEYGLFDVRWNHILIPYLSGHLYLYSFSRGIASKWEGYFPNSETIKIGKWNQM